VRICGTVTEILKRVLTAFYPKEELDDLLNWAMIVPWNTIKTITCTTLLYKLNVEIRVAGLSDKSFREDYRVRLT
jgi:hypothetical protein